MEKETIVDTHEIPKSPNQQVDQPIESQDEKVSLDSSDDEGDDIQPTEEDVKFIADASSSEEEIGLKKRKKRKRVAIQEDLDDEDLELLNENYGIKSSSKWKKLRRKGDDDDDQAEPVKELVSLFDEEEKVVVQESREDDLDDLDDFIIDDEDEDGTNKQELRALQLARKENKRKMVNNMGMNYGISDETWREIEEVFGDGTDYDWALFKLDDAQEKDVKLSDLYEPSEISSRMLTDHDQVIRLKDIPERFQLIGLTPFSESEANAATIFITQKIAREMPNPAPLELLQKTIYKVVKFILKDNFEIPFILTHRKDHYIPFLDRSSLWRLFYILIEWQQMQRIRHTAIKLLDDLSNGTVSDFLMDIDDVKRYRSLLSLAENNTEIMDVQASIQSKYSDAVSKVEAGRADKIKLFKRPTRRSIHVDAKRAGLDELVKMFGVNVERLAVALRNTLPNSYNPTTVDIGPQEAAARFTCSLFPGVNDVLEGARHVLANEIATDPSIKAFVRRIYEADAVITVTPTDKGKKEISVHHPYYEFKYLDKKHVHSFKNTSQFLQITRAVEEGMVVASATIGNMSLFTSDLRQAISSDIYSAIGQEWNTLRTSVIDLALETLVPATVKSLFDTLRQAATQYVIQSACSNLASDADMAGFEFKKRSPVLALHVSPSSCGVVVDGYGNFKHHFPLASLNTLERHNDIQTIHDTIAEFGIELVVLGGNSPQLIHIRAEIRNCEAQLIDDCIARIYATSKRGVAEYPTLVVDVRYAISLARRALDPTMVYAGLFNDDVLKLRLHPLQSLVPQDALLAALERVMINIVASIGVDINNALIHPHKRHTLPFIAGLGPRKTTALLAPSRLESRGALVLQKIVASTIFMNCASFLRITPLHFRKQEVEILDVLDNTRIHPQDYDLARKMAADAIEADEQLDPDDPPSLHVAELMAGDVARLDQLLLEDYAATLEATLKEPKRMVLDDIKTELQDPYRDRRRRFTPPSPETVFTMATAQTDETLWVGMIASALVTKVMDRIVKVSLFGIDGYIHTKNISDSGSIGQTPADHGIHVDQVLKVKVLAVNKIGLSVDLSCRPSDVDYAPDTIKRDPYFNLDWETRAAQEEAGTAPANLAKLSKTVRKTAKLNHPKFQPINSRQAESMLSTKEYGEYILRPSSKGPRHFSISWKVSSTLIDHIDVVDLGGKQGYAISSYKFTEIDELLVTHLDPLIRNVKEILTNPKYAANRDKESMSNYLSHTCTNRTTYGICSTSNACSYHFMWCHVGGRTRSEIVKVLPQGFEFRGKVYDGVLELIGGFKREEQKKSEEEKRKRRARR